MLRFSDHGISRWSGFRNHGKGVSRIESPSLWKAGSPLPSSHHGKAVLIAADGVSQGHLCPSAKDFQWNLYSAEYTSPFSRYTLLSQESDV